MRQRRAAFTLTELIIAVGMVLILMTGIVKVYKYATAAVGISHGTVLPEAPRTGKSRSVSAASEGAPKPVA